MYRTRPSAGRARRLTAAALALLLVAVLGACGDDDDSSSSGDNGSTANADATLDVTAFQYQDVTVPAGGTLAVKNTSGAAHTFTPDNEGDFEEVSYDDGETVTVTAPDEPGDYGFHCEIHPNMQATMTVE